MERRFVYSRSAENRYPSEAVFRTADLEDHGLPYREFRANDQGYFRPRIETADVYSGKPIVSGRSAVPWWTSIGLGLRPTDGVSRSRNMPRNENLESKMSKYYNEDGIFVDSGLLPADKNSKLIKKTTEPQLWRKISDPKRAILSNVNGNFVWREASDDYDKPKTITRTVDVEPSRFPSSMPVGRTPYLVYT